MSQTKAATPKLSQVDLRKVREHTNIFSRLPATYAASRLQGQRLLQHAGDLSIMEWRVLWDLDVAGPMTIRDLAHLQRADHSLFSRALPAMRDKGYVTLDKGAEDGRQVVVSLTENGRAKYAQTAPTMKKRRDALRAKFSPEEIETFVGLLDRLEDFLRQPIEHILGEEPVE